MKKTTYEPILPEDNRPATKDDVARILKAIEALNEQIKVNKKKR